jgi:SPP1 family predicted phage head-tail adaptor
MPIGANVADVGAGSLRELLAFDKRIETDDGHGNTTAEFAEVFRAAGAFQALKGTEAVMADRLEGRQPYIVTVRYSASVALVTTDWRIRDVRSGAAYAITTVTPRARRDYLDMICTAGVADAQ